MAVKTKHTGDMVDFLDHSLSDPMCQRIIQTMQNIKIEDLGITGTTADTDVYHF